MTPQTESQAFYKKQAGKRKANRTKFKPGEIEVGAATYVALALVADKPMQLKAFRQQLAKAYPSTQTRSGALKKLIVLGYLEMTAEITPAGLKALEAAEEIAECGA